MEKQTNLKYEYVPDVSHIMGQAGYRMDLMAILAEPLVAGSGRRGRPRNTEEVAADPEPLFVPAIFHYSKGDING